MAVLKSAGAPMRTSFHIEPTFAKFRHFPAKITILTGSGNGR
jgi:hypothetical protein